ncbi:MAG: hypothetical protein ACREM3_06525 [Candidatus Rokuibacteriota bacterium]
MPISPRLTTTVGVAALLAACSGPPPASLPVPVAGSGAAMPAASPAASVETARAELPPPALVAWEAKGRRDPFEPLSVREGAAGTTVSSAKLTGIVRSRGAALALVETPDGLGYILKPGDTLGDGRLLEIGQSTVVFSIVPRPGTTNNRVVLRLAGE